MKSNYVTVEEMWALQQIKSTDVNYDLWEQEKCNLRRMSAISRSCIFAVDVYKSIYSFASESFSDIFGYNSLYIKTIEKQGDYIEEMIHPDDRKQIIDLQIKLGNYIYDLPPENRNDYRNIFQFRMLNSRNNYINVITRNQVILTDSNKKAWIIMGIMDVSPDQVPTDKIKCSVINLKNGEIVKPEIYLDNDNNLTKREKEILNLIRNGFLSKEIASKLELSIYTVNNHRKNILNKLKADNSIEAINLALRKGLIL